MFFKTGDTGGTLVAGRGCSFILGKLVTQLVVPLPTCSVCDALERRTCVRVGWFGWVMPFLLYFFFSYCCITATLSSIT